MVPSTRHTLPFHHLDSLSCGRHELLENRLDDWHQCRHYPRYGGLRDVLQITQKFLRSVLAKMPARKLHRSIQSARLRPPRLLIPRPFRRAMNTQGELLHLRQSQACNTIVSQRSFPGDLIIGVVTQSISPGKAVVPVARRGDYQTSIKQCEKDLSCVIK